MVKTMTSVWRVHRQGLQGICFLYGQDFMSIAQSCVLEPKGILSIFCTDRLQTTGVGNGLIWAQASDSGAGRGTGWASCMTVKHVSYSGYPCVQSA